MASAQSVRPAYNAGLDIHSSARFKEVLLVRGQRSEVKGDGKGKGNVDLYSASSRTPLMRSDMDHTMLPAKNTISAFTRKHSPDGATTHIRIANA